MTTETTEATIETVTVKEYVAEISFLHVQPVESSVVILGKDEQEVRDTITNLFHKRQDLVIASVNEKPKGYREETLVQAEQGEATTATVLDFPTKKDLN